MTSSQSINKCGTDHKRYTASRIKEGFFRKKVRQPKRKCGKPERKSIGKKSAFVCCRTESTRTEWQVRKWKQNFRDCKPEQIFALGADHARSKFEVMCQISFGRIETPSAQMPGQGGGRRNSENEQEQCRTSQQLVLPAQSGFNESAPASSMELDLPRVRGVQGESGRAEIQAQKMNPVPGVDVRWKRMLSWGTCAWKWDEGALCKEKEKRNSQGTDPRTFEEISQGGDPSTSERDSQGKAPRTFEGSSQWKDARTFQGRCHKEEMWRIQEKKEGKWKKRRPRRHH